MNSSEIKSISSSSSSGSLLSLVVPPMNAPKAVAATGSKRNQEEAVVSSRGIDLHQEFKKLAKKNPSIAGAKQRKTSIVSTEDEEWR